MNIKTRLMGALGITLTGLAMWPLVSSAAVQSQTYHIAYGQSSRGNLSFHLGNQDFSSSSISVKVHPGDQVQIQPEHAKNRMYMGVYLESTHIAVATWSKAPAGCLDFMADHPGTITIVFDKNPPVTSKGAPPVRQPAVGKLVVDIVG